jgi:hypothetical protein
VKILNSAIRRELRVAFSSRAQPVWFRIIKWACIFVAAMLFHNQCRFWWTFAGLAAMGNVVALFLSLENQRLDPHVGGWNGLGRAAADSPMAKSHVS